MDGTQDMRARILTKAKDDSDFRARLLADPKGTVEAELGVTTPDALALHVHEETATDLHLILPADKRLRQEDLEAVAGGNWVNQGIDAGGSN